MGGACSAHGEMRSAHRIVVWKARYRLEDNIKMDLWEIDWKGVD